MRSSCNVNSIVIVDCWC